MSADRDVTRIVRSWLHEDAYEDADRILNVVLDEIDTTPQRRPAWSAWRRPFMNTYLKVGLAAAVVVLAAFIGIQLLGGSNVGTPGPSPSAAATGTPRPSPTAPEPTYGPLGEGPFVLTYEQLFGVRTTVTIPAPDWHGIGTHTSIEKHGVADPPQGAGLSVFGGAMLVYGDPCAWESTTPDGPAVSLDELAAALSAQALRDATPPVDVTVGGYPGKMLTLHVPDDAVFTDCDGGEFRTLVEVVTDDARVHQGPGQIDEVWVVDVGGTFVFFDAGYFAATPAKDVEEMRAMVESATFEVP